MKIILAAGGTGGPVAPLLAVADEIRKDHPKAHFLLLGTNSEFEKKLAVKYNLEFKTIPAGKWRRYFSLKNIVSPFLVLAGIIKSIYIVAKFRPDVVFSAGGYVSVPVALAAWLLRKKIIIHQQDVLPSLTNRILAPFSDLVTVTFESSLKDFSTSSGIFPTHTKKEKVVWTGNPFREDMLAATKIDPEKLKEKYKLSFDLPVLLVVGGATGAMGLNKIIEEALPELAKYVQVVHLTGRGKAIHFSHENYHTFEFLENIGELYFIADLVVARAGLSTITELAAFKKVSIIVPMPESHQESNALILAMAQAALCILQEDLRPEALVSMVRNIMPDYNLQKMLKENISKIMPDNAAHKISRIIIDLCKEKK